ncbi:MAG: family 10 glycosylhydrolase [Caldilineales bacterium]|nr:family 10 glycosylhydrolase [Caldilineales bacterium]
MSPENRQSTRTASTAPAAETRAVWVSRFDWTEGGAKPANPARLDQIVEDVAGAGFNMILFQVRGVADAYYHSSLEPWAERVSGIALGQAPEPFWDPLTHIVQKAHDAGLQVHAWFNVYPVADGRGQCEVTPDWRLRPMPAFFQLAVEHGVTLNKVNGLQWLDDGTVACASYRYASPASKFYEDHLLAVASELAYHYAIDGLHLDHVRYAARNSSCDPVSLRRYHNLADDQPLPKCVRDQAYSDWQRQLISDMVRRIYEEVTSIIPGMWLSAAVWPVHTKLPDLARFGPHSSGFADYYQDSKAWAQGGYIDALMPMIYPALYNCPDDSFWNQEVWRILVADFEETCHPRFLVPGIGARYCTFDEIANRIDLGRNIGVAGHAFFSYRGLVERNYLRQLAAGPYSTPAKVSVMGWR